MSRRLGRPKQLLDFGGEALLRRVIRQALASDLAEVILVLGHEGEAIAAAVGELGQRVVINPAYEAGQSTSLRCGLRAVDPRVAAVMFLLGDQPHVGAEIINTLIRAFRESAAPIVVPTYGGTAGNPALFAREIFPELAAIEGDRGAREIVQRYGDRVLRVPVSDGPPPRDIDTEEDYLAALRELGIN